MKAIVNNTLDSYITHTYMKGFPPSSENKAIHCSHFFQEEINARLPGEDLTSIRIRHTKNVWRKKGKASSAFTLLIFQQIIMKGSGYFREILKLPPALLTKSVSRISTPFAFHGRRPEGIFLAAKIARLEGIDLGRTNFYKLCVWNDVQMPP